MNALHKTPLEQILTAFLIICIITSSSGCIVAKRQFESETRKIRVEQKITKRFPDYRLLLSKENLPLVFFEQKLNIVDIGIFETDIMEERIYPYPSGGAYIINDIFLLKYVGVLWAGISTAYFLVTDENGPENPLPIEIIFVPGMAVLAAAFSSFVWSPLDLVVRIFNGRPKGFISSPWVKTSIEPEELNKKYAENLSYFQNLGDWFLTWTPFYPGMTNFYIIETSIINTHIDKRELSTAIRWDRVPSSESSSAGIRINGALTKIAIEDAGTLRIPEEILDRLSEDDPVKIELVGSASTPPLETTAARLGVKGVIPRILPDGEPLITLQCSVIEPFASGAGQQDPFPIWWLVEIHNHGRIRCFNLQIQIDPGNSNHEYRIECKFPQKSQILNETYRGKRTVNLLERFMPGEKVKIVIEGLAASAQVSISDLSGATNTKLNDNLAP